jgi:transcriptional regulator of NAD metabolism
MEQQKIDERLSIKTGYIGRITSLEAAMKKNQEECEKDKEELRDIIEQLREKIRNEAEQRVQGEISLVSTLIQIVDAPQLKAILKALEQRQVRLQVANIQEISDNQRAGAEGNDSEGQ